MLHQICWTKTMVPTKFGFCCSAHVAPAYVNGLLMCIWCHPQLHSVGSA